MEWEEMRSEDPEEAKRRIRLEVEYAEFQDQHKRHDELKRKNIEQTSQS